MAKTNAARILDAAGIHYELREYNVDEDDLSAPRVAEKIARERKTIVDLCRSPDFTLEKLRTLVEQI